MKTKKISLKKVAVHNLKSIDLELDAGELIVFSGVSGSGKSSMAFDTIYMEGQRRYVESLSTFARRQMEEMKKPKLESQEGISPTISIEQKTAGKNPRSTVGTLTEIYDYLRVLFARIAIPHCPESGEAVRPSSRERILKTLQGVKTGTSLLILAPWAKDKKGEFKEDFQELSRRGFTRVEVDGRIHSLSDTISLDGSLSHTVNVVIDKLKIAPENNSRIAEAVFSALDLGRGMLIAQNQETGEEQLFSMHAFSPKSGLSYRSLEPQDFSFNSPAGMCPRCNGMGKVIEFDLEKVIDPKKSISEDCCSIARSYETVRYRNIYDNLAEIYGFDIDTPWKHLSEKAKHVFLCGTEKKWTRMRFVHPVRGTVWWDLVRWEGVLQEAKNRYREAKSPSYKKKMEALLKEDVCPDCHGSRIGRYPAAATLGGMSIGELSAMTIERLIEFFNQLKISKEELRIADELLKEIKERLHFLMEVGLNYLTLERSAPTLSGGESQRVRLASQIGSGLVGITYILDEPSIGLHPRDNSRLIKTLEHLRDIGNTVIVVEHDEETMGAADTIVDFGPGAGSRGGEIVFQGPYKKLLASKESLTGGYLSGRLQIKIPEKRRDKKKGALKIKGATHHNLKGVNLTLPLGLFIAVTGVSGSGKSSLILDTLWPALKNKLHHGDSPCGSFKALEGVNQIDKVIAIDQSPIGKNPRSNPATYIKLFDEIRDLFSNLPEAKARGFKPGRFSFNVREGSCTECRGLGMLKVDMDFLDDAWIECPHCEGQRFDAQTLSILYKGKSIWDVLEMEVEAAAQFFENIPSIKKKLNLLEEVGLGYLKLGQSSTTLSGGEAERIKLAKELVRPDTHNTLYILDEPTTGLHFHDINLLLKILNRLVDHGNTVVVVEHNMDVVKVADHIIDLGPEGGEKGGMIIAEGTPESIAQLDTPTGVAVRHALFPTQRVLEKKRRKEKAIETIRVEGAEENNLKCIDVEIPREKITVCTGPSGSGKSSFAFDTVYNEGMRRYIESLSPYARQFVKQGAKPKVARVEGLSPAIAIEQKQHAGNPRSTVGTQTEIWDFLRILFARLGQAFCPETGEPIKQITKEVVKEALFRFGDGEKVEILAPLDLRRSETLDDLISRLSKQGFVRIRLNGTVFDIDEKIPYDPKQKNSIQLVIDRLVIKEGTDKRVLEAIERAADWGKNRLIALHEGKEHFYNLSFATESSAKSYPPITPHTFAFNVEEGMCPDCLGIGTEAGANLLEREDVLQMPLSSLFSLIWEDNEDMFQLAEALLKKERIDPDIPLEDLSSAALQVVLNGSNKWHAFGALKLRWPGINTHLAWLGKHAFYDIKQGLAPLLEETVCPTCRGDRLNALARNVKLQGTTIGQVARMPIERAFEFFKALEIPSNEKEFLDEVKDEVVSRLEFLIEMGMGYLALERKAPSLSGGEAQRIRLARQLGSKLTGVLYVLDEPTVGLHPQDNERLNNALVKLKKLGNTLLLVEHDPQTIALADFILDFGPGAGEKGGHITAKGTLQEIKSDPKSLTGRYLSKELVIQAPEKKGRKDKGVLIAKNLRMHNLKNLKIPFPLGKFIAVTGVSGSGKSTLIEDVLYRALKKGVDREAVVDLGNDGIVEGIDNIDKVLMIDQNPIGHTVRSDVSTYVDLLLPMRHLFAELPQAKMRGLESRHFSRNHKKGMCTHCYGLGYKRVDMLFLPSVEVPCEECGGLKLNPVSLEVSYHGKNMGEWLQATCDEALKVFEPHPKISKILKTLISVGLGYLKLGQEMQTLSGGEAQRIKLSRELAKRSTGKTLYLLDEPTTGLHPEDIDKLLKVLHALVDKGNTVIAIEHELNVIRTADVVIELGPVGGEKGGYLLYQGAPEGLRGCPESVTGKYI